MKSSSLSREQDINFDINVHFMILKLYQEPILFNAKQFVLGIWGWRFFTHQEFFDTYFKDLVISQVEYYHLCMNWTR